MAKAKKGKKSFAPDVFEKAIAFLNRVNDPSEISHYVKDDPEQSTRRSAVNKGVGIGKVVAARILIRRYSLPQGQFSSFEELEGIEGLGEDKLHDLLFTVSEADFKERTPKSELEAEIRQWESLIAQTRHHLMQERTMGVPDRASLQEEMERIQAQTQQVEIESTQAKEHAKRRKREIDDWKYWYNALPPEEQQENLKKLKSEIDWRAEELNQLTPAIQDMLAKLELLKGELEVAQQQLLAYDRGVFDKPIDDDPRLVSLQKALDAARAKRTIMEKTKN